MLKCDNNWCQNNGDDGYCYEEEEKYWECEDRFYVTDEEMRRCL